MTHPTAPHPTRCSCGQRIVRENAYARAKARMILLSATPKEVWAEYLRDGYSMPIRLTPNGARG